jgi:signal peptidase
MVKPLTDTYKLPMVLTGKKTRLLILVFLCGIGLAVSVFIVFGKNYDFYVVVSESMVPSLHTGDLVIIDKTKDTCPALKCLQVGDIIVFEPDSSTNYSEPSRTIIHRIDEITFNSEGQRVIKTKGDANPQSIPGVDYPITENSIVGKVTYVVLYIGLLLMYVNLIAQIFVQPFFYILIAAAGASIFLLEYKRRGS